jgi:hypothetical protein
MPIRSIDAAAPADRQEKGARDLDDPLRPFDVAVVVTEPG